MIEVEHLIPNDQAHYLFPPETRGNSRETEARLK